METKEIDGVLYKLVPEKKKKSCKDCAFYGPNGAFCTILTDNCNKGFVYRKVNEPISTSNLKPFNLEEAKAGKPVCTRDGRKARIICFDKLNDYYPIIALVDIDGEECIFQYTNNGEYLDGNENTSQNNLMMLPEKKEGWIIKPKDYQVYQYKEEAEEVYNKAYQVVAKIIWEE